MTTKKNYMQKRSVNLRTEGAEEIKVTAGAGKNIKYQEIAKEFVNNGFRQTLAYSTVTGCAYASSRARASRLFNKPEMVKLIHQYVSGGHDAHETKDWAITRWQQMVNCNVLDYFNDEGSPMTIKEMKELPQFMQLAIKKIDFNSHQYPLKINGKPVMDDDGEPVLKTEQKIVIELVDKQKALSDLARAQKWIETHMNLNITSPVSAEILIQAQIDRQKKLTIDRTLDGESKRIENDQAKSS